MSEDGAQNDRATMRHRLSLLLVVSAIAVSLGGIAANAAAAQPSLTSEIFFCQTQDILFQFCPPEVVLPPGSVQQPLITAARCNPANTSTFAYHVEGVAVGPYPGPFVEDGTFSLGPLNTATVVGPPGSLWGHVESLSATYSVESAQGTVTGRKHFTEEPPFDFLAMGICLVSSTGVVEAVAARYFSSTALCYEAQLPTGEIDRGTSHLLIGRGLSGPGTVFTNQFAEEFVSDPTVASCHFEPTTVAECRDGGWANFGIFKNQGDCVSFVSTGGKNEPGKNQP